MFQKPFMSLLFNFESEDIYITVNEISLPFLIIRIMDHGFPYGFCYRMGQGHQHGFGWHIEYGHSYGIQ